MSDRLPSRSRLPAIVFPMFISGATEAPRTPSTLLLSVSDSLIPVPVPVPEVPSVPSESLLPVSDSESLIYSTGS